MSSVEGSEGTVDLAHRLESLAWSIFQAQGQPSYRRSLAAARGLASSLRGLALEYDKSRSRFSESGRHECLGLSSLVEPATGKGEALSNLSTARHELELSVSGYAGLGDCRGLQRASAFLSLVLWMYPGGFSSFTDLALEVLEISGKVLELRDITGDLASYCLVLFTRLRALPRLVQIKRANESDLEETLRRADSVSVEIQDPFLRGLVLYASAFARFRSGLIDLGQSLKLFDDAIAVLRRSELGAPFVAFAMWETGLIYQWELAEGVEDQSSFIGFIEKAYARYRDAWKIASSTTWQRCKGEILYDMAYCFLMMAEKQLDSQRRLGYLRHSLIYGEQGLRWLSFWSPYESGLLGGSWVSATYRHLAAAESDPAAKRRLNSRALSLYRRAIKVLSIPGISHPYTLENIGELHLNAARSEHMLSEAASGEKKKRILRGAAESAERSLEWFTEDPDKLAKACLATGRLYCELSETTGDRLWVSKASQIFRRATLLSRKLGWWIVPAECRWNLARAFDGIGDFAKSAGLYREAAKLYGAAIDHVPDLEAWLDEYSRVMSAWSNLERGKFWHTRENYSKSASLCLESSRVIADTGWHDYRRLFSAMALIESAEDESAKERHDRALKLFAEASDVLREVSRSLPARPSSPSLSGDYSNRVSLVCARKRSFLRGRMFLERARFLSRVGRHSDSASCYSRAVRVFAHLFGKTENPMESEELQLLSDFCSSLAKMEAALHSEKGDLFKKASMSLRGSADKCGLPKKRSLLLGMSDLSSAMAAAAEIKERLEFSLDSDLVSMVESELRSAAAAFGRGGLQKSRDLAHAIRYMFVGSMFVAAAEREISPQEKMDLYETAGRSLEKASSLFSRVGNSERVEYVQSQIMKVGEEQKIYFSLGDIFGDAMSEYSMYGIMMSSTEVSASSSGAEFDHAVIELSCKLDRDSVTVGESFSGKVELANLGGENAVLLSLVSSVPDGVVVDEPPDGYAVVGGSLPLRGLVLKPYSKVCLTFSFRAVEAVPSRWRPQMLFRDDIGRDKLATCNEIAVNISEEGDSVEELAKDKSRCIELMNSLSDRHARAEISQEEYESEVLRLRRELTKIEEFENRLLFEVEDLERRIDAASARQVVYGDGLSKASQRGSLDILLGDMTKEMMLKRGMLEILRGVSFRVAS